MNTVSFMCQNAQKQSRRAPEKAWYIGMYCTLSMYFPQVVGCASTARSLGGPKCRIHTVFVPDPRRILNTPFIARFPTGTRKSLQQSIVPREGYHASRGAAMECPLPKYPAAACVICLFDFQNLSPYLRIVTMSSSASRIEYSEKYADDMNEYR